MADLIAYQSGDWTGATTWKGVATSTGAKQGTISTQTTIASSTYSYSPTFTIANGVVIEGVLLHLRGLTALGTFSVALSDDNGVTATRVVTVNGADLPSNLAYVFFRFGTTLTGDGGTDYRIGVRNVGSTNCEVSRSATTADWVRYLRTDTTATIAATDVTFITRELTGQGTNNGTITVTMNSTASTAYGECNIGANGVVSYGTSASTNYILDLAGNLNVWGDGTLNIGTSGTRIPSTSTALLEFTNAVNVDRGLEGRAGSTINMYGASKTTTNTLLTATTNSGQKVVAVESTTGWVAGDTVALASTTRIGSQSESNTIATVDSSTQITLTNNLTNTHHGTAILKGEVINLTRNVQVRGTSTLLAAYIVCRASSKFNAEYVEFLQLGSGTAAKRGVETSGNYSEFVLKFCSIRNFFGGSTGIFLGSNSSNTAITTVEDNSIYHTGSNGQLQLQAHSNTPSIQRNYFIGGGSGTIAVLDVGGTIKDNRFAAYDSFQLNEVGATIGTFENNVFHSCVGSGLVVVSRMQGEIKNCSIIRASMFGFQSAATGVFGLSLTNSTIRDCGSSLMSQSGSRGVLAYKNVIFDATSELSLTQPAAAIGLYGSWVTFDKCEFLGSTSGGLFVLTTDFGEYWRIFFNNCVIGNTIPTILPDSLLQSPYAPRMIHFDKFNQTAGSHRTYKAYGRTESDQSTFRTAAPSEALLPNTASLKLPSGSKKFAVASGQTATVNVYVRKSATYNGNQPRLIVKANSIAGITTDTVLDTMSGGTGVWEELTGTTATVSDDCVLEVYVDCDGTAGTVNVDDWSVT